MIAAAPSIEQRLQQLEETLAKVVQERDKAEQERDEYRKLYLLLQEQNERLKRGLLGQKAERLPQNDAQLSLAVLGLMLGDAGAEATATTSDHAEEQDDEQLVAEHTRRKARRNPLAEHLPRVPIKIVPPEVEREGLDAFELIGEDVREVLERRSASQVVVQLIYQKFVRKDRERNAPTHVVVADAVELPIERGLAGPGMLADTIVRRWQDHLPLNRLESMYAREGIELARSTLCTWHSQLADLTRPVVEAMRADAFREPYLCVDATGVLVQAPERCRHGHFWVLVAPEKHVLFGYSKRHDSAAVDDLLAGYKGYLVADAHAVYDHLYETGDVTEVGCWAHARRYGFKSLESDPERAKIMLAHISALFAIERTIADAPRKKREATRKQKSKAIVDKFFEWCHAQAALVLDESPISKAIGYARNQESALRRFLDDGRLPLHNNISELQLRRQVVGRRNWIFVGSDDGALVNTVFVSLLASCSLRGIEPWAYLRDFFCLLPSWPRSRVLELAPAYWQKTFEQPETQAKLAANVFRRVVLGQA